MLIMTKDEPDGSKRTFEVHALGGNRLGIKNTSPQDNPDDWLRVLYGIDTEQDHKAMAYFGEPENAEASSKVLKLMRGTVAYWELYSAAMVLGRTIPCERCQAPFRPLGLLGVGVGSPAKTENEAVANGMLPMAVWGYQVRDHGLVEPDNRARASIEEAARNVYGLNLTLAHLERLPTRCGRERCWTNVCPSCRHSHPDWTLLREGTRPLLPVPRPERPVALGDDAYPMFCTLPTTPAFVFRGEVMMQVDCEAADEGQDTEAPWQHTPVVMAGKRERNENSRRSRSATPR